MARNVVCQNFWQKLGKKGLQSIRQCYFSLKGEDKDTFLVAWLQLIKESLSRNKVSFDYYLNINDKYCRQSFKIALGVHNMRLNCVQHRCLSGYSVFKTPIGELSGRGLMGQDAIN